MTKFELFCMILVPLTQSFLIILGQWKKMWEKEADNRKQKNL